MCARASAPQVSTFPGDDRCGPSAAGTSPRSSTHRSAAHGRGHRRRSRARARWSAGALVDRLGRAGRRAVSGGGGRARAGAGAGAGLAGRTGAGAGQRSGRGARAVGAAAARIDGALGRVDAGGRQHAGAGARVGGRGAGGLGRRGRRTRAVVVTGDETEQRKGNYGRGAGVHMWIPIIVGGIHAMPGGLAGLVTGPGDPDPRGRRG